MKMMPTFSTDDETTLQDFCRQIAPLVENVRVKRGPVAKQAALGDDWILNVSKLAKASTSDIIKAMLDKTREIVGADRASLFLVDRRKKELWSKIADNTPEIRVKLGQGIVGAAVKPVVGVTDGVMTALQGVSNTLADAKAHAPRRRRRRLAPLEHSDARLLVPYAPVSEAEEREEAEAAARASETIFDALF